MSKRRRIGILKQTGRYNGTEFPEGGGGMDPRKILIAEDDEGSRKLLHLILARSGYDVIEAVNGIEALDVARRGRPDLIIMDLQLPGMSGDEVLGKLKADPSTQNIPVIITTFYDPEDEPVQHALAAGATKILQKPTSMKTFEEEVQKLVPLE